MNGSLFFWRLSCGVVSKPKGVFYYHVKKRHVNTYNTHRQRKWVLSYAYEGSMYAWYSSDTNYQHNEAQHSALMMVTNTYAFARWMWNTRKTIRQHLAKCFLFSVFFFLLSSSSFVSLSYAAFFVALVELGMEFVARCPNARREHLDLFCFYCLFFAFVFFFSCSFFILTLAPYHYVCRSFGYSRGVSLVLYVYLHRIRIGPIMLLIISSAGKEIFVSVCVCVLFALNGAKESARKSKPWIMNKIWFMLVNGNGQQSIDSIPDTNIRCVGARGKPEDFDIFIRRRIFGIFLSPVATRCEFKICLFSFHRISSRSDFLFPIYSIYLSIIYLVWLEGARTHGTRWWRKSLNSWIMQFIQNQIDFVHFSRHLVCPWQSNKLNRNPYCHRSHWLLKPNKFQYRILICDWCIIILLATIVDEVYIDWTRIRLNCCNQSS